jgi:hypothetical protein
VRETDLFRARRRGRSPIESAVHYLAHARKPPVGLVHSALARGDPAAASVIRKSQFQLSVDHNFYRFLF